MPVIDFLERNVKLYGNETALVELNRISVREQSLQCIDHHRLFYKSRCTQHNLLSTGIRERNGTDPEYGWSGGDIYYG